MVEFKGGKIRAMSTCIAIANQKGGVGKTTICVNLAWSLASMGFSTLLLDLDPQGNASSSLDMKRGGVGGMQRLLTSGRWSDEWLSPIIPGSLQGLSSSPGLKDLDHGRLTGDPTKLRELLEPQRDRWAYILMDCPPSLGTLTMNALTSADSVLIPAQAEFLAMEGLVQMVSAMSAIKGAKGSSLELAGVAINMLNPGDEGMNEAVREIRAHFEDAVFRQPLVRDPIFAEAPSHGVGILRRRARCPGALAWSEFTREFLFRTAA